MTSKSPGPQKCRLILNQTLVIQLSRPGNVPDDFWMYDSGYMIFQNFLAANSQCWWNPSLIAATRSLKYVGHIAPGMLLVTAEPCALELLRNAYSRSVLKPPSTYSITFVGDIEDCIVLPTIQGQFTPLPEALCDVIMDLTAQGQSATIENIRVKLTHRFPHMRAPSTEMIYDTLVQLNQERKIYQTAKGYFIVTPERRRSRSRPRENTCSFDGSFLEDHLPKESRTMLLTNSEAVHSFYGEISTERDGDLTHQCIQTNLADVICGGNPNDKIMYARSTKRRSSSFPNRSLERRHSLRIFGSSKRLQRCISTRSLSKNYSTAPSPDSSSSEYQSTTESTTLSPKNVVAESQQQQRPSLLSRLFRRSGRQKTRQTDAYSAQFPPTEWFNSRTVHLHNVGTQTNDQELSMTAILPAPNSDGSEISQQSSTLPRRHRRHMSSESTFMIWSRDCSPIRRHSPHYSSGSLPRSIHSGHSKSKMRLQSRSPAEESARMQQRHRLDEKISQEREKHFRSMQQSGPSSLESGKTSVMSGPSSIDSGKNSSSRTTSCMSSLDSNGPPSIRSSRRLTSNGTAAPTMVDQYLPSIIANSMSNNSITLQVTTTTSGNGHGAGGSVGNNVNQINGTGGGGRSPAAGGPQATTNRYNHHHHQLAESASSGSSSSNCSNSTKIYVQNSPVRSVIKLENGKLADNANVVIINKNETIAGNNHKEVIQFNALPGGNGTGTAQPLETQFDHLSGDCYVVFRDGSSLGNGIRGGGGEAVFHRGDQRSSHRSFGLSSSEAKEANTPPQAPLVINNKLNNLHLSNKEAQEEDDEDYSVDPISANNHRKLSLQTSSSAANGGQNLIYKNLLRNNSDCQSSMASEAASKIKLSSGQGGFEPDYYYNSPGTMSTETTGSLNNQVSGSVGCLGEPMKQLNTGKSYSQNKLNDAGCNNTLEANSYLSKLKSLNSIDSLATIYQKSNSLMTVGSEPNLVGGEKLNNNHQKNDKLNNMVPRKETNLTKSELDPAITGSEDMYDFPSLTDLSFNSLAALKILQELNSEKVKPATGKAKTATTTMCP